MHCAGVLTVAVAAPVKLGASVLRVKERAWRRYRMVADGTVTQIAFQDSSSWKLGVSISCATLRRPRPRRLVEMPLARHARHLIFNVGEVGWGDTHPTRRQFTFRRQMEEHTASHHQLEASIQAARRMPTGISHR